MKGFGTTYMAGEFSESEIPVRSELFIRPAQFNTRINPRVAQGSPCFVICEECQGYSGNHKSSCSCCPIKEKAFKQFWDIDVSDEES